LRKLSCTKFLLAVIVILVMAGTAGAAYNLNFTLYNNSGWYFRKIWLSPSGNKKWNANRDVVSHGNTPSTLASGHNTRITFDNVSSERRNVATWDLRIDASDGKKHEFHDIPLSQIVGVEIGHGFQISYLWPGEI